jgi:hypothetical protein
MVENGSLIPNTFQHPNLYVDRLAYYLTPQEQVVLQKAVREILGWEDKRIERKAYIALSVFVEGKFDKKGNRLCHGCGLGEGAVREALKGLHKYRILLKGIITQKGQLFTIQIDADAIDWEGLEERREEWDEANRKRTEEATKKRKKKQGVTSDVGGNVGRGGTTLHDTTEVTSDDGGVVTSDVDKETHLKPKEKPNNEPNGSCEPSPLAPSTPGAEILFAKLKAEFKAKGRRAPKRFQSLANKQKWETAEEKLEPGELKAAIVRALQKGICSVVGVTDFVAKWNGNGRRGNYRAPPAPRTADEYEEGDEVL